jgi:hypothetical protein
MRRLTAGNAVLGVYCRLREISGCLQKNRPQFCQEFALARIYKCNKRTIAAQKAYRIEEQFHGNQGNSARNPIQ